MRRLRRHARNTALVALLLVFAAACGADDPRTPARTDATRTPAEEAPTAEPVEPSDANDEEQPAPTPAAIAQGRRLDQLAAAFAPVSARINYLVAAETLREDAVESEADPAIEAERSGVVRIEVERMQVVLDRARPRVAAIPVSTAAQQQVQQLLLEAIDARRRAGQELVLLIRARGAGQGASLLQEREEAWQDSWDASLRATREATTLVQQTRAELGLPPAPEEALR